MKELKQVLGLKKGQLPAPSERLARRIGAAVRWLNGHFARGVLGGRTALQAVRDMPIAERLVDCQELYRETCAAIESAVQGCTGSRAARLAERKATFTVLEHFNQMATTRGGKDAAKLNTDKTR